MVFTCVSGVVGVYLCGAVSLVFTCVGRYTCRSTIRNATAGRQQVAAREQRGRKERPRGQLELRVNNTTQDISSKTPG